MRKIKKNVCEKFSSRTKDDKQKFLTERDELDEKHAFLRERYDKLHEDYEKSRAAVAASARQIASLQDREANEELKRKMAWRPTATS